MLHRLPFTLITADVAEATAVCLLAQAEEAERLKMPPVVQERMVIEEFGRCLIQIIDSANRTKGQNAEMTVFHELVIKSTCRSCLFFSLSYLGYLSCCCGSFCYPVMCFVSCFPELFMC